MSVYKIVDLDKIFCGDLRFIMNSKEDYSDSIFINADLSGVDLKNIVIKRGAFKKVSFEKSDLSGADLSGSCAISSYRPYSNNFSGAKLITANLSGVDFSGANFKEADLRSANLSNAKLKSPRFEGADLRGANLCGVKFDGIVCFDGANLTGAIMAKSDLCNGSINQDEATKNAMDLFLSMGVIFV